MIRIAAIPSAFLALTLSASANVNFVPDYSGDAAGEGFNDPALGAARKAAFEFSLGIWEDYLMNSYAGETVTVRAVFDSQGGTMTSATLGSASANDAALTTAPLFAGTPLASHLNGFDTNGVSHDISITFNSDVDNATVLGTTDFYYGTDATPGTDVDFVDVALHEIGHGLGFSSDIRSDGSLLNPAFSKIYDQFLFDAAVGGTALSGMTDAQRLTAITSGNLYWSGANATAANGGNRVEIYAPNPYEPGSSVSHVDEGTHGTLTMSPSANGNIIDHQLSNLELGMLQDMGWTVIYPVPEPSTLTLILGVSMIALGVRRRK